MLRQPAFSLARPQVKGWIAARVPVLAAMMLGFFVVGMVGFSDLHAVHDAAHDARHSNAFPCH